MTNDRLKEIQEMLDKITPGLWQTRKHYSWCVDAEDGSLLMEGADYDGASNDAQFIAAAPQIVRELLEELKEPKESIGCIECGDDISTTCKECLNDQMSKNLARVTRRMMGDD